MTREEAKDKGYTHIGEIYGIRCYFHYYTNELEGTNWINSKLIDLAMWIDLNVLNCYLSPFGFTIKLIEEL